MPTTLNDIRSFHEYAAERISNGGECLELDQLLDEWRHRRADSEQSQQDLAAVREALRDFDNGDKGRPAKEVIREIRAKYNLD